MAENKPTNGTTKRIEDDYTVMEVFKEGHLTSAVRYAYGEDGKEDHRYEEFYDKNEKKSKEDLYLKGKLVGSWTYGYDENGNLKEKESKQFNEKEEVFYSERSRLNEKGQWNDLETKFYNKNKLHLRLVYDDDGHLTQRQEFDKEGHEKSAKETVSPASEPVKMSNANLDKSLNDVRVMADGEISFKEEIARLNKFPSIEFAGVKGEYAQFAQALYDKTDFSKVMKSLYDVATGKEEKPTEKGFIPQIEANRTLEQLAKKGYPDANFYMSEKLSARNLAKEAKKYFVKAEASPYRDNVLNAWKRDEEVTAMVLVPKEEMIVVRKEEKAEEGSKDAPASAPVVEAKEEVITPEYVSSPYETQAASDVFIYGDAPKAPKTEEAEDAVAPAKEIHGVDPAMDSKLNFTVGEKVSNASEEAPATPVVSVENRDINVTVGEKVPNVAEALKSKAAVPPTVGNINKDVNITVDGPAHLVPKKPEPKRDTYSLTGKDTMNINITVDGMIKGRGGR